MEMGEILLEGAQFEGTGQWGFYACIVSDNADRINHIQVMRSLLNAHAHRALCTHKADLRIAKVRCGPSSRHLHAISLVQRCSGNYTTRTNYGVPAHRQSGGHINSH